MQMKKAIKASIIFVLVVAVIVVAVKITIGFTLPFGKANVSWLNTRAYQGNRITINMHVTIDGKEANISSDSHFLKHRDGYTVLKDRANSYDTYKYPLIIEGENTRIPLNITVNHWNWWEIVESDLYIDIDTKSNTYTIYENYGFTAEYPVYHWETEKEPEQTVNGIEHIDEYAGCKG